MKVFAVIPAWDEAGRIGEAIKDVQAAVDGVIVVDDGSLDATKEAAAAAGATVLRHAVNRGQGAALKTGTEAALRMGADVIVHVDADGQHDASFIAALVAPIKEGRADVVFGSRFLGLRSDEMPFVRQMLLVAARIFNTFVVGIPSHITDPQNGMRAFSRAAAERVDFHQDRMAHCSEILRLVTRSDLKWTEVPIRVRYTSETLSKGQKSSDALRIVWDLLIGAFRR
jgi:glycosyltransferase involved in cell wall biosynthesis